MLFLGQFLQAYLALGWLLRAYALQSLHHLVCSHTAARRRMLGGEAACSCTVARLRVPGGEAAGGEAEAAHASVAANSGPRAISDLGSATQLGLAATRCNLNESSTVEGI